MSDVNGPRVPDISRRQFLQGASLAGVAAFLAACSGSTAPEASQAAVVQSIAIPTPPPVSPTPTSASPTPVPSPTGPLKFANWPAYIDLTGKAYDTGEYSPGSSPTIEKFKQKYGVDVDYEEKIEDNKTFYATIQPQLQSGSPTGWDLIVITDWLAAKVVSNGWAEKLDHGNLPNCTANLRDGLKNQPWDPTNDYHYPWQSGMTGIGYNKKVLKQAGHALPKSLKDLYALPPDKVSFLTDARDTFGLGLLKLGKSADPATTTTDDLQAVHDDIRPLVDQGLIFADNSYLKNFASHKTWAAMVWSGDLASSGSADDEFIFPEEGCMVWTDNMIIPKGATNKYTAELMMNFVYDPAIAAEIEDYVYYVCPVNGAAAEIKKLDPGAETNPLIFPPANIQTQFHNFQFLPEDVEAKLDELYLDLTGG